MSGRGRLEMRAKGLGLDLETHAPGDGVRRYQFFAKRKGYRDREEVHHVYTARGAREAEVFLDGYEEGGRGTRTNPPRQRQRQRVRRNPGKFADTVEDMLYSIDHDQEMGSVDELGWYGLVSGLLLPEAKEYVASVAGDIDPYEFAKDAESYDWPLNAIIVENNDGSIDVTTFKENREAMREWRLVEKAYENYYKHGEI
jgi:hypothetical protein